MNADGEYSITLFVDDFIVCLQYSFFTISCYARMKKIKYLPWYRALTFNNEKIGGSTENQNTRIHEYFCVI